MLLPAPEASLKVAAASRFWQKRFCATLTHVARKLRFSSSSERRRQWVLWDPSALSESVSNLYTVGTGSASILLFPLCRLNIEKSAGRLRAETSALAFLWALRGTQSLGRPKRRRGGVPEPSGAVLGGRGGSGAGGEGPAGVEAPMELTGRRAARQKRSKATAAEQAEPAGAGAESGALGSLVSARIAFTVGAGEPVGFQGASLSHADINQ